MHVEIIAHIPQMNRLSHTDLGLEMTQEQIDRILFARILEGILYKTY